MSIILEGMQRKCKIIGRYLTESAPDHRARVGRKSVSQPGRARIWSQPGGSLEFPVVLASWGRGNYVLGVVSIRRVTVFRVA